MNIGKNIKFCREFKKLSRSDLASMLDVNVSSISRYETGVREPNIATINNISEVLEVEIDTLLNGVKSDIYTRDDIFKLYNKLNTKVKLSTFLGFKSDYDMEFMAFKDGLLDSRKLYFRLAEYLDLTEKEVYCWILSDIIYSLIGYDDFKVSSVNRDDIKYIVEKDILEKQSIDSLLREGLSKKNEALLSEYLSKRNLIKLEEIKSRSLESKNKSINDVLELIENEVLKDKFTERIDDIKFLKPILKHHGIEFNLSNNGELVTINMPKDNICSDLDLDIFLDFIDKISWGIEREIDYLKRLYD